MLGARRQTLTLEKVVACWYVHALCPFVVQRARARVCWGWGYGLCFAALTMIDKFGQHVARGLIALSIILLGTLLQLQVPRTFLGIILPHCTATSMFLTVTRDFINPNLNQKSFALQYPASTAGCLEIPFPTRLQICFNAAVHTLNCLEASYRTLLCS